MRHCAARTYIIQSHLKNMKNYSVSVIFFFFFLKVILISPSRRPFPFSVAHNEKKRQQKGPEREKSTSVTAAAWKPQTHRCALRISFAYMCGYIVGSNVAGWFRQLKKTTATTHTVGQDVLLLILTLHRVCPLSLGEKTIENRKRGDRSRRFCASIRGTREGDRDFLDDKHARTHARARFTDF